MSKKRKTRSTISPQTISNGDVSNVVGMPSPVYPQEQESLNIDRVGDILRQTREKRGEDLFHIAEYLCIKPDFLKALEESHYDLLPADAYVIGFLRSYAVYLGLDGKDAIDRYRHEMAGRRRKPVLNMPIPAAESRAPSAIIMAGAVIGFLLIYAVWYGVSSSNRSAAVNTPTTTETILAQTNDGVTPSTEPLAPNAVSSIILPSPAPATQALPSSSPLTPSAPLGTDNSAPNTTSAPTTKETPTPDVSASAPPSISIIATQPSWILINDNNGKAVFDRVLKAGETYKVPNGKGYTLTTGNIGGISLSIDGIALPNLTPPKDGARVLRGIPLDPAYLRANTSDQGD